MQRFQPPPETPELRAKHEAERKHFVFASILIIGAMLLLPILGGLYVYLVETGTLQVPQLGH